MRNVNAQEPDIARLGGHAPFGFIVRDDDGNTLLALTACTADVAIYGPATIFRDSVTIHEGGRVVVRRIA